MGSSATAILLGDIHYEELAQRLKDRFTLEEFRIEARDIEEDGYVRMLFADPEGNNATRQLYVFFDGRIHDHMDVFDGQRTLVSMGSHGSAGQILTALAEVYGGYVRLFDDGGNEDQWEFVRGDAALMAELPPKTKLKLELAEVMSPKEAVLLSKIADDPACLEDVIDAFVRYRERKSELDIPATLSTTPMR
jgi:hypothetical protein